MNRRRGAALLEFAMALPFALTLFVGIGDFSVYFWRQVQMEELARGVHRSITAAANTYAAADTSAFESLARAAEAEVRRLSDNPGLSVRLSRHYACPQVDGNESELSDRAVLCPGERTYLRVQTEQPVAPLLAPLRALGYPATAFSRHVLRLQ